MSSQGPFVTLTKGAPLALKHQTHSSGLQQKSKGVLFPGTVFPLKVFPLVWPAWLPCRRIVLCNQTQNKVSRQGSWITLTVAPCTSSQSAVPWFDELFWSNSVYLCFGVVVDKSLNNYERYEDKITGLMFQIGHVHVQSFMQKCNLRKSSRGCQ